MPSWPSGLRVSVEEGSDSPWCDGDHPLGRMPGSPSVEQRFNVCAPGLTIPPPGA